MPSLASSVTPGTSCQGSVKDPQVTAPDSYHHPERKGPLPPLEQPLNINTGLGESGAPCPSAGHSVTTGF